MNNKRLLEIADSIIENEELSDRKVVMRIFLERLKDAMEDEPDVPYIVDPPKLGEVYVVRERDFWMIGLVTLVNNGFNNTSAQRGRATFLTSYGDFKEDSEWCYSDREMGRTFVTASNEEKTLLVAMIDHVSKTPETSKLLKKRNVYSEEFKKQVVSQRLLYSVNTLATEYDLRPRNIYRWIKIFS